MISNKYAKANNPYMDDYDEKEPNSYIAYLDANNLYGWAMSQYLPEKEFCWMSSEQLSTFDVTSIASDSTTGYILEVDLDYPSDIHDHHGDYPLAPEGMVIDDTMLSPYSQV